MHGIFTSVLWYLEFFSFVVVLILFFCFFLYLAQKNYACYVPRFDTRKKHKTPPPKIKIKIKEPKQRPVCCDLGCVWFCRMFFSITTIALCYYFAYRLVNNTKLKFSLFVA